MSLVLMFSVRNAVVVAIMQVGVIVAGVLAAGLWCRTAVTGHVMIPFPTLCLFTYGICGFVIPLVWGSCAAFVIHQQKFSDGLKSLMFWFGVLMLLAMAVIVLYADASPFFHITWSLSGGDDAE
jgi:hypothetical protein